MTYADQLEFPSEWSLSGRIVGRRDYEKEADYQRNRILNIARHYREDHGEIAAAVGGPGRAATPRRSSTRSPRDSPEVAARFRGVDPARGLGGHRGGGACPGSRRLVEHYADEVRIALEHPVAQARKLTEFFPAESWETAGYQRVMPVELPGRRPAPHLVGHRRRRAGPIWATPAGRRAMR